MTDTPFDPQPHIRCLKCGKNLPVCKCGSFQRPYLETSWRLVWLRDKYPPDSVSLETEIVAWEPAIVFKATATFQSDSLDSFGQMAVRVTAFGSATPKPGQVYSGREVEKAETAAIGRLCARLGFGTQFTGEDDTEHLADAPVTKETEPDPDAIPCAKCGSPMEYKEGTSKAGKDYRGWFCPNSAATDKHPPVWIDVDGHKPAGVGSAVPPQETPSTVHPSPETLAAHPLIGREMPDPRPEMHPAPIGQVNLVANRLNDVPEDVALALCEKYGVEVAYNDDGKLQITDASNLTGGAKGTAEAMVAELNAARKAAREPA